MASLVGRLSGMTAPPDAVPEQSERSEARRGFLRRRRPVSAARRMADALRALALDATGAAGAGEIALPLGMADVATALFTRVLKYDAADPAWPDRDRFVLSAGRAASLLYALLHLTGHDGMDADALAGFRTLHAPTRGHPEHGSHPAIEATTGPPGQGIANAVGMALAERMLAARFGRSLVDHRVWVIAAEDELMQGVAQEAASLAGHWRLERLAVLYEESVNEGHPACPDDIARRFAACGWAVKAVDGHDGDAIEAGLSFALRSRKPTLLACRTATASLVGSAHSPAAARDALRWPHPPFAVPGALARAWQEAGGRGASSRRAWLKRIVRHASRAEFERVTGARLPDAWHERLATLKTGFAEGGPLSTAAASRQLLDGLAASMPELMQNRLAGAAAIGSTITPGSYGAREACWGGRTHGMAACLNGVALHDGLLPAACLPLAEADALRPALRLAAQMRTRLLFVFDEDGLTAGGAGPAFQPVEAVAALRALPGLLVLRPGDAVETAEAMEIAIRTDGPVALVVGDEGDAIVRRDAGENRCLRGGYVLAEAEGPRRATLIASGSELSLALETRSRLAATGVAAAVVSLPCWELFAAQDEGYRETVLGGALRIGIEAATGFGWERWLGAEGCFIGMTEFGASAPPDHLYRRYAITAEAAVAAVLRRLN